MCAVQSISRCQRHSKRLLKDAAVRTRNYVLDLQSYVRSITALLSQRINRCQQRSKRLLKNAAVRTLSCVLDPQPYVQLITASLGGFAHAAASWLVSASTAVCRRWLCICEHLHLLARSAARRAKRAAASVAAAAAHGSRRNQKIAASAQQRPAGRQSPTKRRQQCNSPAPDAAAAAKPSRQARRRLRNRAGAAQNTLAAAADIEHAAAAAAAAAAALHINKASEQGNEAVAETADDAEHSTMPTEQLRRGPDLFAAETYAAVKPCSVAEVRSTVCNCRDHVLLLDDCAGACASCCGAYSSSFTVRFQLLQDEADPVVEISTPGAEAGSIDSQDAAPASADATARIAIPGPPAEPAAPRPASAAPAVAGQHIAATSAAEGPTLDGAADATCVMCLDLPKDVILAPCGHQCLCRQVVTSTVTQPAYMWRARDVEGTCSALIPSHCETGAQLLVYVQCTVDERCCCRGCTLILMSSSAPTSRCCPVCRTKVGVRMYVLSRSWTTLL